MKSPIWGPIDYTNYAVVDVEATVYASHPWTFPAAPQCPENFLVSAGLLRVRDGSTDYTDYHCIAKVPPIGSVAYAIRQHLLEPAPEVLVGHNIKFDLAYIYWRNHQKYKGPVWDTSVAHYMITAQGHKMPSLDDVAAYYGLGSKITEVADLWAAGMRTEDIEPSVLLDYMKRDIELTAEIYRRQQAQLKNFPALRDHILRISTASLFLGEAETHGIPMDFSALEARRDAAVLERDQAAADLMCEIVDNYGLPPHHATEDILVSPKTMGCILWNKPLTIESYEPAGRVLVSGKIAKRRKKVGYTYTPRKELVLPPALTTSRGSLSTADDALDALAPCQPTLVAGLRKMRAATKLLSTYLEPIILFMSDSSTGRVYPSYHLTTTNTGRTSSSGPNAQQFPPEIEKCVRATEVRAPVPFGEPVMLKVDFKQLQICGVAMLSGDKQLIEDLRSGVDVHYVTGKEVFGWKAPADMTKETRRIVKNTNFGLIFGGKAAGIAKQTGVDKAIVSKCIDAFYGRYPDVKRWVDKNIQLVDAVAVPVEGAFLDGAQVKEAYLQTPAGRVLRFKQRQSPEWMTKRKGSPPLSFSPNEIANYPVQGYTDGDLALIFLALLATKVPAKIYWVPCNFIHDGLWIRTKQPDESLALLQDALLELNREMALSVPLGLDFVIEDINGEEIRKGSIT